MEEIWGTVFNIQRFCLHDGPGIRTTVFLKGCPLRCLWCSNPESVGPEPQLGFARTSCNRCGKCFGACPQEALTPVEDGLPRIDRSRCTACGDCVAVCAPEALSIYGKRRSVTEVFQVAVRDRAFYGSDGGITVSGGEPLRQPDFVAGLFRLGRDSGVSTVLETSGFVPASAFRQVLVFTDLVLFDLKHLDSREHRRLAGRDNGRILDNARLLERSGAKVQFRIPLIPGLNDGLPNIKATSAFLRELLGDEAAIELMPYHRLGVGKYQALDRSYPLDGLPSLDPGQIDSARQAFEESGVRCLVSR
ncbi:MAG: glycyl-radical enzyme activating protein [Chloroflexi bacterium]|nr:glycyl-radical enzyme activating protein [Chloroflexota bacterium]